MVSEHTVSLRTLVLKRVNLLLREMEGHCAEELAGFPLFSQKELSRRITQLILKGYYTDLMKCSPKEPSTYGSHLHRVSLGSNLIVKNSGETRIAVQWRIVLANFFKFTAASTYLLVVFLGSLVVRRRGRSTGVASTIIGPRLKLVAFMEKEDIGREFARFCREGPLPFLNEAELIVCREEADATENERLLCISENPWVHLLKTNAPSISEVIRVLYDQARLFLLFSLYCLRFPAFSFLHRDLAFFTIVSSLSRRGLIRDYVISNSEYYDQELWLNEFSGKSFSSNMVWYSSGFEWYKYKGETEFIDSPENWFFSVDHHWVWTARQKACLEKTPHVRSVTAVGPIMYYLPGSVEPEQEAHTIAIFDMTPRKGWHFRRRFGDHFRYYNSAETVRSFIEDIVEQIELLERRMNTTIRLVLKSKRTFEPKHDVGYLTYIRELEDAGRIELLRPRTNIFDLAKKCSALVVLPWTSPGEVGAHVSTPTLYYDPTNSLVEPVFDDEFLHFAQDKTELGRFVAAALGTDATAAPSVHRRPN